MRLSSETGTCGRPIKGCSRWSHGTDRPGGQINLPVDLSQGNAGATSVNKACPDSAPASQDKEGEPSYIAVNG